MKLFLEDSDIGCLDFELVNIVFDFRGPTLLSHDRDLGRDVWSYADISGCFVDLCAFFDRDRSPSFFLHPEYVRALVLNY